MQADRLRSAISSVLLGSVNAASEIDDIGELVDFLVFEIAQSNVQLPAIATEDSPQENGGAQRSLEELESMPITSILGPHLIDLAHISTQDVPLVIDEILDLYIRETKSEVDAEDSYEMTSRLCELCEPPAALTQHHLIPRSEHDLFVKRGMATLEECRSRLAMLCRPCHSAVHRAKTTRELAVDYNTVEKLLEIPEVVRFVEWNAKRKVMATVVHRRKRK